MRPERASPRDTLQPGLALIVEARVERHRALGSHVGKGQGRYFLGGRRARASLVRILDVGAQIAFAPEARPSSSYCSLVRR